MHAVLEHATCCPADFSSCYVEQAKLPGLNTKQHRHKIFHKVKELVKFEAVCTFRSNSFVYCFFFFLIAFMWKQRERMDIFMMKRKKKKSCPNHCIGHNPFPLNSIFLKRTLAPLATLVHFIGSSTELPFPAHISPDAMQHVLGVCRGYRDPADQPEHHTGTLCLRRWIAELQSLTHIMRLAFE